MCQLDKPLVRGIGIEHNPTVDALPVKRNVQKNAQNVGCFKLNHHQWVACLNFMQKKEACRGEHVLCNGRKQRDGAKKSLRETL